MSTIALKAFYFQIIYETISIYENSLIVYLKQTYFSQLTSKILHCLNCQINVLVLFFILLKQNISSGHHIKSLYIYLHILFERKMQPFINKEDSDTIAKMLPRILYKLSCSERGISIHGYIIFFTLHKFHNLQLFQMLCTSGSPFSYPFLL